MVEASMSWGCAMQEYVTGELVDEDLLCLFADCAIMVNTKPSGTRESRAASSAAARPG